MKRVLLGLLVAIMSLCSLSQVAGATKKVDNTSRVVIGQAYFGSPTDASDEFITIVNIGSESVDIGGLSVEYKSATGKSWYEKGQVVDGTLLVADGEYVFSTKRERNAELGSGLSQSAGNIRLITAEGEVLDALAWGNGDSAEGTVATKPSPGEALLRKHDEGGALVDSQNNAVDFELSDVDKPIGSSGSSAVDVITAVSYSFSDVSVEITELLPDPASPASDSVDEFIELYNAGLEPANLKGWKLRDNAGHTADLDGVVLSAGQYLSLTASQTKLSLNNSGDTISLLNPTGEVVMTTPDYGSAKEGYAFGVSAEGWGWLKTPTPGAVNSSLALEDAIVASSSKAKTKKKADKVTEAKKKSAKANKAKAKKAKTPKLAKTANAGTGVSADMVDDQSKTIPWTWLVAGLGIIAVGYGVYEYRPEITSFISRLRAKFNSRA